MAGFAESLNALWAVQKHDAQIVREMKRVAKLAAEVAAEQAKSDTANQSLAAEREKHRLLKTRQKELEGELQRMDARARQLDAQGTEAGSKGAEKQRARIDEMENEGLMLLAQISEQEAAVAKADHEAKARHEALTALAATNGEQTRAAQQVISTVSQARLVAVAAVAAELLQVYDEANSRHPGNALCRIDGEFCGGCQANLNTQLMMQVRARAEVLRCPHCLRILDAPAS